MLDWLFGSKKPRILSLQDQQALAVAHIKVDGQESINGRIIVRY